MKFAGGIRGRWRDRAGYRDRKRGSRTYDYVQHDNHQWDGIDLDDCVQCHEAHTFRVDGTACTTCHADIVDGGGKGG